MTAYVNDTLSAQILRGELWTGNYDATVNPGNDFAVLFSTGSSEVVLSLDITLSGAATIWLYEDTVTSADGTSITNYNMFRSAGGSLLTSTFHTPTVSSPGTCILKTVASSTGEIAQAIALSTENGIVLKANSKYRVYILNGAVEAATVSVSWYLREL